MREGFFFMIQQIVKRDGRMAPFEIDKITNAILGAAQASGGQDHDMAQELAEQVEKTLEETAGTETPTVEQVQDTVEKVLIESGHARTAKKYILYRNERTRVREMNTRLMKVYEDLTFKSSLENDVKRENANIDGDTAMGTMLKYGSEGAKQFYEMYVLNPRHAQAHRDGDIHIHDLDFYTLTTTCCQIDLLELFHGGFSTGHGVLREPNDIYSYSALACIAIQANQNEQHGGQSVVNFDYGMAPGVKKTYFKRFRDNLARALELLGNVEDAADVAARILDELEQAGVRDVLALRGDRTPTRPESPDFKHASDLTAFIKWKKPGFSVHGACYPEAHPEAATLQQDVENLRIKQANGAEHLLTQLFFDNMHFYRFLNLARRAGVTLPVSAGVMPIVKRSQIERTVALSSASLPSEFTRMVSRFQDDPDSLYEAGIEYAVNQLRDLIEGGADGVHLYAMNDANVAAKVYEGIKDLL